VHYSSINSIIIAATSLPVAFFDTLRRPGDELTSIHHWAIYWAQYYPHHSYLGPSFWLHQRRFAAQAGDKRKLYAAVSHPRWQVRSEYSPSWLTLHCCHYFTATYKTADISTACLFDIFCALKYLAFNPINASMMAFGGFLAFPLYHTDT